MGKKKRSRRDADDKAKKKRLIVIDQEKFVKRGNPAITWNMPGKWTIVRHPYVTIFMHDSGEWAIILMWSAGQSGHTAWAVASITVDMGFDLVRGRCKSSKFSEKANRAIKKLTKDWRKAEDFDKAA